MADQAVFQITIAGTDVSERFNPILESIGVTIKSGATADTARIELADDGGRIIMPDKGDPVTVLLGWRSSGMGFVFDGAPDQSFAGGGIGLVFEGTVDEVRSRGARHGGRVLTIEAKGFDAKGKAKEKLSLHQDDATLQSFLDKAAKKAGIKGVKIASALASIERPYWAATSESFIHLGHRLAGEVGGTFKIVGDQGVMVERNGGQSASGGELPSVTARWGENLLSWDISPILARPRYGSSRAEWYDVTQGKMRTIDVGVEQHGEASPATHTHRYRRADEGEAKHSAGSNKKSSERNRGAGHALIIGDPAPQPEGLLLIEGARPGIDGAYRIDIVNHHLRRHQGYHTNLGLKQPQGSAGSDDRSAE